MPTLSLYHYRGCYFCRLVLQAAQRYGVEVELRDIHQDSRYREQLIEARGRKTVPVLRIEHGDDVQWLAESRQIISFLADL